MDMNRWISVLTGAAQPLDNLRDLFLVNLRELYSVADEIIDALPGIVRSASTPELQVAMDRYLKASWKQKSRLDEVFRAFNIAFEKVSCAGIRGIVADGARVIGDKTEAAVRNTAMLGIVQQISHYKTATYGTAAAIARLQGWQNVANSLQQTVEEEQKIQQELSRLAASNFNQRAA
jgi:ferritin-like metal-binding protein YciE